MKKQSLLWELTHEKLEHTSYLFGSIHLPYDLVVSNPDWLEDKIKGCKIFAAEIDLSHPDSELNPGEFVMPEAQTLEDSFTKRQLFKLKKLLNLSSKEELDSILRLYPLVLIQVITSRLTAPSDQVPLDFYLWQKAQKFGLECKGLEDISYHYNIIRRIKIKKQLGILKTMLRKSDAQKKELKKAITWYKKSKIKDLYRSAWKQMQGMRKIMLYERNEIHALNIKTLHQKGPVFAMVGAAHLTGKYGILRLLKKAGFKLKAIH